MLMYYQKTLILFAILLIILTSCSTNQKGLSTNLTKSKNSIVTIITDSKRYKLGESIDIEVGSKKEGFINIFFINPKSEVTKIDFTPIKKEFRSYLKTNIVGEHKLIVIYTPKKVDIKRDNFSLKNLKEEDIYDIYTFQVNR